MGNGIHPLCWQPGRNCLGIVGGELLSIPTEDIPAAVSSVLRELGGEGAVETRDEQSHGKPYFKPRATDILPPISDIGRHRVRHLQTCAAKASGLSRHRVRHLQTSVGIGVAIERHRKTSKAFRIAIERHRKTSLVLAAEVELAAGVVGALF